VADLKFIKHNDMTDEVIKIKAVKFFNFHMMLAGRMVDDSDSYEDKDYPEELFNLLRRQRDFGAYGKLLEGDMLPEDFEMIVQYSALESVYGWDILNHADNTEIDPDAPLLIKSIELAAAARLKIVIAQGVSMESLYGLYNDSFHVRDEVELIELACLADMSVQSVRNEIAKDKSGLKTHSKLGKSYLPVEDAINWLKQRNSFKPTINLMEVGRREAEFDELYVPVAKDGSYFNHTCRMTKGYQVGGKGEEQYFESFSEAQSHLFLMTQAKWRRPNNAGNFGTVSASEWKFIDRKTVLNSK
jgi:hypothetical protein